MSESDPLMTSVYAGDRYKPFGELTLADVEARADELRAASRVGAMARIASIARAWTELARAMRSSHAGTVAELGRTRAAEFARRTWASPPF